MKCKVLPLKKVYAYAEMTRWIVNKSEVHDHQIVIVIYESDTIRQREVYNHYNMSKADYVSIISRI